MIIDKTSEVSRLREIRMARDLTQQQIAAALDSDSPQWISMLETGKRQLTEQLIRRLAKALDVPPAVILDDVGEPIPDAAGAISEATRHNIKGDELIDHLMKRLHPETNHAELYEAHSISMNLAGVLKGDLVYIDLNQTDPPDGSIVLVELAGKTRARRLAFREILRPYLIARSTDDHFNQPSLLEAGAVDIKGRALSIHRQLDHNS